MPAEVNKQYTYDHPDNLGYGEHTKQAAGYGELSAEMTELDLKDGTPVFVIAMDEESGWPIIDWTDSTGIYRITTIDPDVFDQYFVPASRSGSGKGDK
jgi:hypothetical protein